ncbi:hypothetical protein [Jannaschia pohangensis]|uniref:Uncharacterized protein n=1 Tax=Jannaschia pohangensis TaxID=390807 RepID=A0A1I3MMI9_9RHOB|nr:hypothetical protein [Jannaschia pohangensis]SFI98020.1 hypothetical protein SAMN04488095_1893 [Jannaschia pohangensis]
MSGDVIKPRRPLYKRWWVWVLVVLGAMASAIIAAVLPLFLAFPSATDIDPASQANRGYTERAAAEVFGGALAGVEFAGYGELKSAFNSDLSAVALIPAAAMGAIEMGPTLDHEAGVLDRLIETYWHLDIASHGAVTGRTEETTGRDQIILYRLQDGTGLLRLQSF